MNRGRWMMLAPMLMIAPPATVATGRPLGPSEPVGALPAPGTYTLDPPHTFIYFAARHLLVGTVRGRFDRMTGTIVVAKNLADCAVDVTIDAASLSTQNSMRDEDLRSPAYFAADSFPTATYRGRGIRPSGAGWVMDGSLTIHGASKVVPLTFTFGGKAPTEVNKPSRVAFHASASAQRADFRMTRDLLSELGPRPSGPDVWLEIDAEALSAVGPGPSTGQK